MRNLSIVLFVMLIAVVNTAYGQPNPSDSTNQKFYIGSSFFMLGNLIPQNRPDFAQLNFGHYLTDKDVVAVEFKTWKYAWPLGIPYGNTYEAPEEEYPGFVREFGAALVYQRFWWKGMYTAVHAMNALQRYVDEEGQKIQNGYQLFMTYRLGYHLPLFNNRFFIEPSIAATHWPINTNVPEGFEVRERDWPNYFLFEPGLHFGVKF